MANGLTYTRELLRPEDADELALTLAPLLRAGDVLTLNGDLGAGKTRFTQGLARALGITEPVVSPTFNIVYSYPIRPAMRQMAPVEVDAGVTLLQHFDIYRLEDPDELEDIAYWELLESDAVSLVEWADKFPGYVPTECLDLHISVTGPNTRIVRAHAYGERARRLLFVWAADPLAQWTKFED